MVVEEDSEEARKSEERQAQFLERKKKEKDEEEKNAARNVGKGEKMESCSCIEGNPCMHIAARTGKAALRLPRKMAGRTSPSLSALFACILSREAVLPDRVL